MRYSRRALCFQVNGDFLQMIPHNLLQNPPPNETKPLTVVDLVSDNEDDESCVSEQENNTCQSAFYEIENNSENQSTVDQKALDDTVAKQKALEEAVAKRKALEAAAAKRKAQQYAAAKQKAQQYAAAKQKAQQYAAAKQKAQQYAAAKQKAQEDAAAAAKQKAIKDANAKRKQLENAAAAKQKARNDTIAKLKALEEAATAAAKQKEIEDDAAKRNALKKATTITGTQKAKEDAKQKEHDNTQKAPTKAATVNQEEICLRTSKRVEELLEMKSNKRQRTSNDSVDSSIYSVVDIDKTFQKTLTTKKDSPNTDPEFTSAQKKEKLETEYESDQESVKSVAIVNSATIVNTVATVNSTQDIPDESAVTILQSMSTDVAHRGIQRLERNDLEIYPSPYRSLKGQFIGRGVRTKIFIRKGAFICRYNGTITESLNRQHLPYVVQLSKQSYLDCYDNATIKPTKCIASMINTANRLVDPKTKTKLDSKKNNCELRFQPTIVSVYALRDIQVGEELLVAYNCQVDLMR